MSSFDARDLLSLWEMDPGLPPAEKAIYLLGMLSPRTAEPGDLTIGQRDCALLVARGALFGDALEAAATCGRCDAALDVPLRVSDIVNGAGPGGAAAPASLELGDVIVELRPPTADDAVYAGRTQDETSGRRALLERCVVSASRRGEPMSADELEGALGADGMDALSAFLEALDPLFEIRLGITCGECGDEQSVVFDIGSYLWDELRGEAERLLDEVCALARIYGWREADVLVMSGARRRYYLERGR